MPTCVFYNLWSGIAQIVKLSRREMMKILAILELKSSRCPYAFLSLRPGHVHWEHSALWCHVLEHLGQLQLAAEPGRKKHPDGCCSDHFYHGQSTPKKNRSWTGERRQSHWHQKTNLLVSTHLILPISIMGIQIRSCRLAGIPPQTQTRNNPRPSLLPAQTCLKYHKRALFYSSQGYS